MKIVNKSVTTSKIQSMKTNKIKKKVIQIKKTITSAFKKRKKGHGQH